MLVSEGQFRGGKDQSSSGYRFGVVHIVVFLIWIDMYLFGKTSLGYNTRTDFYPLLPFPYEDTGDVRHLAPLAPVTCSWRVNSTRLFTFVHFIINAVQLQDITIIGSKCCSEDKVHRPQ